MWLWVLIGFVLGLIAFIPLVIVLFLIGDAIGGRLGARRRRKSRAREPSVANAYYVDEGGLRSLLESLKIRLATSRQVSHNRTLSGAFKGLGAQRGRSETTEFVAGLDLNRLADEIEEKARGEVQTDIAIAPHVRDEDVLTQTIQQLEQSVGETSRTGELLEMVQQAYEARKIETLAREKRDQLQAIANRGSLILLRGRLAAAEPARSGEPPSIYLTALEVVERPAALSPEMDPIALEYAHMRRMQLTAQERQEIPTPRDVAVRVTLPDTAGMTPAGNEVLGNVGTFYGRAIAHTPSYDEASGTLTCVAYAVWGIPAP